MMPLIAFQLLTSYYSLDLRKCCQSQILVMDDICMSDQSFILKATIVVL